MSRGQRWERLKLKGLGVPYSIGVNPVCLDFAPMTGSSSAAPAPPPESSPGDRLDSWKEIAAYFQPRQAHRAALGAAGGDARPPCHKGGIGGVVEGPAGAHRARGASGKDQGTELA